MKNFGLRKYHQPPVALYIRITEANGTRRYERLNRRNPRLEGGVYCLHFYEEGKRKWQTVGTDLNVACAARMAKESELFRKPAQPAGAAKAQREAETLARAIERYLAHITALRSQKTAGGYAYTLNLFKVSYKKSLLKDVNKQDLADFIVYLKQRDLSDRTISNGVGEVVTFLRANDIKDVTVRHKYTEKIVKAYHPDDLKLLFCAANPEEWITFQFFLTTGAREQEVMHALWSDVDFKDGIYTVRDHPKWGFVTKDHEERELPLPSHIIEHLKSRVRTSALIFPTKRGKPNGHFLRTLKVLAKRAGVNPEDCGLHKFRKTFATFQHENGVSARTIQKRLGHSSLETTLMYLAEADVRSAEARAAVDETFAAFA